MTTPAHPKWIIKFVHNSKVNAVNIVNWDDHHHIATIPGVFDWCSDGSPSEGKQAARLIAAAPELLEALQALCNSVKWTGGVTYEIKDKELQDAREAIAKATE